MMKLSIVSPCYNEQEMLPVSAPRIIELMNRLIEEGQIHPDSFVLFVNDGSTDKTWQIISELHSRNPMVHGLDLTANVGHQYAILAGMLTAAEGPDSADAVITIDADLQDPLDCIPEMIQDFKDGSDVVYGVRSSRKTDSFFKRFTAESFYKFQSSLGLKTIYNHADFRLMSRRAILELAKYGERNLYLRGIIPMMGFPASIVEEERAAREAGTTKYTMRKMLTLALDGITSFSIRPMYLILTLGVISVAIGLGIGIYVIVSLIAGRAVLGWSSLMLSIWLVGGMLMISVGLVGVYVGKVYVETKQRPRYHIGRHLH